jgi:hypothetical protein
MNITPFDYLKNLKETPSWEEQRGMRVFISKMATEAKKKPFVFACPDGTLLKISVYTPNINFL